MIFRFLKKIGKLESKQNEAFDVSKHFNKNDFKSKKPQKNKSFKKDTDYNVCIIGAGVTGLYTALYFEKMNARGYKINYEILESDNRVGGRVLTARYDIPKGFNENF